MKRPNLDEYFMNIAHLLAARSTCLRRQNGALAVQDKRIIATGYNGQMPGAPHCEKCLRAELNIPSSQRLDLCRAIHAEENSVVQCAKYGISMDHSTIYTLLKPCSICFKLLVGVGVHSIIYEKDYPDELTNMLIKEAGYIHETYSGCGLFQIKRA